MGVRDQAARYAAQADPEAVVSRVLRRVSATLHFRAWVDTRTTPRPGPLSEEIVKVINHQDGVQLLRAWFHAALYSPSLAAFTAVLQQ